MEETVVLFIVAETHAQYESISMLLSTMTIKSYVNRDIACAVAYKEEYYI